jgi:hypothetical protein
MSSTNTGGTAFPGLNAEFTGITSDGQERYEIQPSGGMTLRDYFAAKAMQATVQAWILKSQYPMTDLMVAENAYSVADAMLEAREQ